MVLEYDDLLTALMHLSAMIMCQLFAFTDRANALCST